MKKLIMAAFAIFLMVLMTGCTDNTPVTFNEEALKEQSTISGEQIARGEYGPVIERFSNALKMKLSTEELGEGWNNLARNIGAFEGVDSTDISVDKDTG